MERVKYKVDREKFKKGCIAIFKKWSAFRIALDQNPQIINYITNENTIEINDFLEILYDEILTTITKNKFGMKELIHDVAECLKYFINDYFKIELDDNSDFEIAEILIKLYNELKDKNEKMLNDLITKQNKITQKYSIEFPITGKQMNLSSKEKENNSIKEKDTKKKEEMDEEGFVVVRKGKKGF